MLKELSIFLIIFGIIFTSIGGFIDMSGKNEVRIGSIHISKGHVWSDGTYVTLLAIALLLLNKCI